MVVSVVSLDVLGGHGVEMAVAEDECPVDALVLEGADVALTDGVGQGLWGVRGAWTGLLTIRVSFAVRVASKDAVSLMSLSRMRNVISLGWSASFIERLRACWVAQ